MSAARLPAARAIPEPDSPTTRTGGFPCPVARRAPPSRSAPPRRPAPRPRPAAAPSAAHMIRTRAPSLMDRQPSPRCCEHVSRQALSNPSLRVRTGNRVPPSQAGRQWAYCVPLVLRWW
ncbi:hypothetical protein FDA94_15875 [Herbidospora galbida]|uniref:Uncharacterized protein n=1 Tax=Herbidospora galbida TaxID=2575442 RepID=A0A4U3MGU6_9ACTN|nr:hypothetical protein FDA94_15875 [Herbidospora galbida]